MFKRKTIYLFLIAVIFLGLFPIAMIYAESSQQNNVVNEVDEGKIDNLQEKIKKYQDKIDSLEGQVNTLAREIERADTQISLTELKIQNSIRNITATEKQIFRLSNDITDIGGRIGQLIDKIKYQKDILSFRIRERYKTYETSPVIVLFGSSTLEGLVKKAAYIRVMEEQDNKVLGDMNVAKTAYNRQKNLFEDKKSEEEDRQKELLQEKFQLDSFKNQLEDQKAEKNRLLADTQNNEAKYQKLLTDAKKELDQITNAVSVLKTQGSTKVKKGQKIGIQGNTGFSKGDHLHFGVYKYSSFKDIDGWDWYYSNYVDPLTKLKSRTVYWDDGCTSAKNRSVGKGDWQWPIDDPTVSQGFGHTCWSNIYYGGKPHPALDMYGSYGTSVYAAEAGNAYFCKNCLGDGANGVFIFHDSGYMTVYWHLK